RASHHHQVAPVWRQDLATRLGHGERLAEAGGHEPRDPERPHSVEGRAGLEDSSEPSTIQMESSDHSGGKPRPTGQAWYSLRYTSGSTPASPFAAARATSCAVQP